MANGVSASFVFELLKKLHYWITHPVLEVKFEPDKTYDKVPDLAAQGRLGTFVHLWVYNQGHRTARNCRGYVLDVLEKQNNTYQKSPLFKNFMELHWASTPLQYLPQDIDPDMPRRLDVCYVHQGLSTLHIFCEKFPSGVQTSFPPGDFRFRIKVRSDNTAPCYINLNISWDGTNLKVEEHTGDFWR